jgi:peptide deformylase
MIREVLRMGDPRLLRVAQPVTLPSPRAQLADLLRDMRDTMAHLDGAGLAAPQIGVDLRVVIFGGCQTNPRYPEAPPVPDTVLINPELTPFGEEEEGGLGRLPLSARHARLGAALEAASTTPATTRAAAASSAASTAFTRAWCSTNATTSTAFFIRCAMRDFRRFGFTDVLNLPGAVADE